MRLLVADVHEGLLGRRALVRLHQPVLNLVEADRDAKVEFAILVAIERQVRHDPDRTMTGRRPKVWRPLCIPASSRTSVRWQTFSLSGMAARLAGDLAGWWQRARRQAWLGDGRDEGLGSGLGHVAR
eukprot:1673576-Prymnesium_polylepis.1